MLTSSNDSTVRRALVVCAHPDDETLWFSSVLARYHTDVICVTCGWDDETRRRRQAEIEQAAAAQGVANLYILGYPDDPRRRGGHRLDIARLVADLQRFTVVGYDLVFTHSPYGEVNQHPHHQDVSFAAHQVFDDVLSVAWNQYPMLVHELTPEEYQLKQHVMGSVYWREYGQLASTYEICSHERFTRLSRAAVDIFYWGIANFGDHHQYLGSKYEDVWGFGASPYEAERHRLIARLAAAVRPRRILEVGAAEGHLTRHLVRVAPVDCLETASVYTARLAEQGFTVVDEPDTHAYDLIVLAAVLEYMPAPDAYLAGLMSSYVITDTHPSFPLDRVEKHLADRYELIDRRFVAPRWERQRHGETIEDLLVYKIGSDTTLWRCRYNRIDPYPSGHSGSVSAQAAATPGSRHRS